VYTAVSGTTGTLAFPVTALAPPGTATARVCTLSNGGTAATGAAVSVLHQTWDPSALMVDPADTWVQASDASAVGDGNPVASLVPGYGNRGTLTQVVSADRLVYKASVSELNGKPGLVGLKTTWTYANLQSTTGYIFSPSATEFVVAICFVPSSGSTSHYFRSNNEGYGKSYSLKFKQNPTEQVNALVLGGTNHGDFAFPNTGTTSPRRLIMQGGGGSAVTLVEPVTGINISETPGTASPTSVVDYMLMIREGFIADFIMITGRTLSTGDQALLNDYWLSRYG